MPENIQPQSSEANKQRIKSFKTSQGSVYTYDAEGKTTRFKTATNEQMNKQDITVFVDLSPEQEQIVLNAYLPDGETHDRTKVYVLEKNPDGTPKVIRDVAEVTDPSKLYLAVIEDNTRYTLLKRASLTPKPNHSVFDSRQFEKDGGWFTERHLGNRVVDIEFGES